jgi:hypothetical protein
MRAEKRKAAQHAIEQSARDYGAKYPKAVASLRRDEAALLAFFDFHRALGAPADWKRHGARAERKSAGRDYPHPRLQSRDALPASPAIEKPTPPDSRGRRSSVYSPAIGGLAG